VYEIEQLKKGLAGIRGGLARTVAEVKAGKYENRESKLSQYASEAGTLLGAAEFVTAQLALVEQTIEQFAPEIAQMERLWKSCASLVCDDSIEEEDLAPLECLVSDRAYLLRKKRLSAAISTTLAEIRDETREREQLNAIEMLTAAGFVWQETDDFEGWERRRDAINPTDGTAGERIERVIIESWRFPGSPAGETAYSWLLEVNGDEVDAGHSGEFSRLLEAVGISRTLEVNPVEVSEPSDADRAEAKRLLDAE